MKFAAQDWPVISTLFDQAVDLSEPQRQAWLESLPQDQRVHRTTLELLLADHAHVQTRDFLRTMPKVGLSADNSDDPYAVGPGEGVRSVGPYRLLRELGRGGMGSVWLAERSDGLLKRQVALKLPHPGLATRAFAERLARERDILASLEHPRIGRLYDAGVTAEGQPYIALAYVQGHTLIAHCRTQALGVRECIALFHQVLEAVQYAHAHLVIHRDLKPSNVLVDELGQVHLLDFGIAKLLVDGQAEATELTLEAGQALTPDYASPEQIAGSAVSTASDVYSLGVLLYELLAGVRPYRLQRQASATLEQALQVMDVPRPSAAARGAGDLPTARALRGDLDTIVLKAMQKSPADRYTTADAFSQDLQRYLDGAPVLARPDAVTYRIGKFVRRHRVGVAAGVLAALALGAGFASTTWQARKANQQAERAQAVKEFLVGLFRQADPNKSAVQDLTAREMLQRGQDELKTKLKDQPRLRAEISGVLSEVYSQLNDEASAKPLAEARRDLTLALDGPDSVSHGEALEALAEVQSALGEREASIANYSRARSIYADHAAERRSDLAEISGHIAFQQVELGRLQEAVDTLTASIPLMESALGSGNHLTLHYKTVLAVTVARLGDFARAERIAAEVLPRLTALDSERPTNAATIRSNLAQMLMSASRFEQAEALFHQAGDSARRMWGPDSLNAITDDRSLAQAQFEAGHFAEAARMAEDAVKRAARALGEDSVNTRLTRSLAVRPLLMVGRMADAEALARRSLPSAETTHAQMTPSRRDAENRLALALIFNLHADEAARRLERLVVDKEGPSSAAAEGRTWLYLAGARLALGRLEEAGKAAEQAQRLFEQSPALRALQLARAQLTGALIAARAGNSAAAEQLIGAAEAGIGTSVGAGHPMALIAQLVRAQALRATGHMDQAAQMDAQARQALEQRTGAVLPTPLFLVF
jgi:eukaryotic-like serine/threonine-protein kinase